MKFITDTDVRAVVTMRDAIDTLSVAVRDLGQKKADIQPRTRIAGGGVTLSTMAAIVPALGVAGAKVYATLNGAFDFLVPLYSTETGKLTALIHGGALTEFRTAAMSRIAFDATGAAGSKVLAVFGAGVQAKAHIKAFLEGTSIERVIVVGCDQAQAAGVVADLAALYPQVAFSMDSPTHAVRAADVVVTATRSAVPLFEGRYLKDGAFVAAVGSSKPNAREIDDVTLSRASRIVVESVEQARAEAGDLILASSGIVDWSSIAELGNLVAAGPASA